MNKLVCFAATSAAVLCSLAACAELTPKAWNGGAAGDWGVAANWDPAGVPTADDAVTIGSGVVTISDAAATAGSLTVASGAKLFFGSTGSDITKMTPLEVAANDFSLTVAGDFTVNGQCAVGGLDSVGKPAVSVGGNLALGANAKMAVYAGEVAQDETDATKYMGDGATVTIGGDLTTASGAWIYPQCHDVTGAGVCWTVGGDVTIAANSGFNADGRGFKYPYGHGCFHPGLNGAWVEGQGGSYGGVGGTYGGNKRTYGGVYGYAYAPFWPGSPGENRGSNASGVGGQNGGGSIRLHVTGDVTLEGSLSADGAEVGKNNPGAGSGGGVWVTCRAFAADANASINVRGGDGNCSWCSGGGGGRVAIMSNSPTAGQLAQLYATGTCDKLHVNCTNVNDTGTSPCPTLIKLQQGASTGNSNPPADPGTGAFLLNIGDKVPLTVLVSPAVDQVTAPSSSPAAGNAMVDSGEVNVFAITPSFVPNTDSRQRRQCIGFVYSNATERVSGAETNYTFDSSSSAEHWIEWDFSDLEYLLRLETPSGGAVTGVGDWYDAGTMVTLTAVPDEGFKFATWSGEVPAEMLTQNPLQLGMDRPRDVKVVFVPDGPGFDGVLTASGNGNWFDAATWGGAGVPGTATDVVIDGKTVTLDVPLLASVKSVTLANAAKLILFGKGTAIDSIAPVDNSVAWRSGLGLSVVGDVTLNNASFITLGGLNATYQPTLTIGGNLTFNATAKMAVYAGGFEAHDDWTVFPGDGAVVEVRGDLAMSGTGNWIYPYAHYVYGETPRFVVSNDVTIAANCGFDANAKGWRLPAGFGYYNEPSVEGDGGWYGGQGGWYNSKNNPGDRTYGFAFAPFWPGSPGQKGSAALNPGGGAIRLHADGEVALNGKLLAEGGAPSNKDGAGSGGGIWITCDVFTPGGNAVISAKGGNCTAGWAAGGGGGRVAIMTGKPTAEQIASLYAGGECDNMTVVTTNVNDSVESPYPTLINLAAGSSSSSASVKATDGTGALLANSGGKCPLNVTILPSPDTVVAPQSEPLAGITLVSGEFTASVVSPNFVPATAERTRLWSVSCVYSNSAGTVETVADADRHTFDADEAGEHWITWNLGNREHLLRATACGGGEVAGVGDWHAENSTVTLTPVASNGWTFVGWAGEVPVAQAKENPLHLTMDRPRDVKAYFTTNAPLETLSATQDGDWFDAATWGGLGVPGPETAVTVDGRKVELFALFGISAASIELRNSAALKLWGEGAQATAMNALGLDKIDPDYDGKLTLSVADSITIGGKAWMSVGGKNSAYHPEVNVGGDLVLEGTAGALAVYAGWESQDDLVAYSKGGAWVTVGGTFSVGGGNWVYPRSHQIAGSSVVFKARDVDIASGGGFNAEEAGFSYHNGPGTYLGHIGVGTWVDQGHGASYGGVNSRFRDGGVLYPEQPTYGNAYAPFWAGSSGTSTGDSGYPGGGAIIIEATRSFALAGWLDADASKNPAGSGKGTGGSVWVRAKNILIDSATAKVTAKGGSNTHGGAGASGGGRICIVEKLPNEQQLANAVMLGNQDGFPKVRGFEVVCTNLVDAAELSAAGLDEGFANVFSAAPGDHTAESAYLPEIEGTAGTAVWLKASAGGLIFIAK